MGCIRDKPLKTFCDPRTAGTKEEPAEEAVVIKNGPHGKATDFSNVVVDDRMPLNTRQAFALTQSWRAIRRNMEDTGVEMFVR
ncbi:hypothetical protein ACOMHN_022039 [Nucella lapillus]